MRIFHGFLIMVAAAILWLLPVTAGVYAFRTDVRADPFSITTAIGVTAANVTLVKPIYSNDTSTIVILSSESTDSPSFSTYNTTSRALTVIGLSDNISRTISVAYDVDALNNDSWDTLLNIVPFIWVVLCVCFPIVGLVAIWTGRAG